MKYENGKMNVTASHYQDEVYKGILKVHTKGHSRDIAYEIRRAPCSNDQLKPSPIIIEFENVLKDGTRSSIWKSKHEAQEYFSMIGENQYGCKITGYKVLGTDGQPVSSEVSKLIYYD